MKTRVAAAALASAMIVALPAQAAVVYDNNGPNGVIGDRMDQWYITADDFTLAGAQTLRSISFTAYQYKPTISAASPPMDQRSLTYWIIADNAGKPGQVLAQAQAQAQDLRFTATGQQGYQVEKAGNYPRTSVAFNLAEEFAAAAGQRYWLALQFSDPAYIYWETADPRGQNDVAYYMATSHIAGRGNLYSPENRPAWIRTIGQHGNHAFALDTARLPGTDPVDPPAAVPEPATWAMMLLGFGMVAATARYRRRKLAVRFA